MPGESVTNVQDDYDPIPGGQYSPEVLMQVNELDLEYGPGFAEDLAQTLAELEALEEEGIE